MSNLYVKNYLITYKHENIFSFLFFGLYKLKLLRMSCFAGFKIGDTLFSKIMPNFYRPYSIQFRNIQYAKVVEKTDLSF